MNYPATLEILQISRRLVRKSRATYLQKQRKDKSIIVKFPLKVFLPAFAIHFIS